MHSQSSRERDNSVVEENFQRILQKKSGAEIARYPKKFKKIQQGC
jgi:hypothetical protein